MLERFSAFLEDRFGIEPERTRWVTVRSLVSLAATFFVLIATMIVAFNQIFAQFDNISSLRIGMVAPRDIVAPANAQPFDSEILTTAEQQNARDQVQPFFDPPDPNVARQQTQLTQQILDFINDVRNDTNATREEQLEDLHEITALTLDDSIAEAILETDEETWQLMGAEIINVLPRVMREPIRDSQLQTVRDQLPTQVSVRFDPQERSIIVAIIEDLIRRNAFENFEATEDARQAAADAVGVQQRTFVSGQKIIGEGEPIDALTFEALQKLDLLTPDDLRFQHMLRAFLASVLVLVVMGLYIARFRSELIYIEPNKLSLLAALFLLMLLTTRLLGVNGNIFLFPTAILALTYVGFIGPYIAIMATLGLALLVGIMTNNSLEIASLVVVGGVIGVLGLRETSRLNSYFLAGVLIGIANAAIVAIFSLVAPGGQAEAEFLSPLLLSFFSGVLLVPTVSFATMYILTLAFNLPTAFKLMDLAQPSKPLLLRLLREAPGTYQHSLQVANLAEQAASAIGADAQLVHVAALYHDIGKVLNPVFFSENQQHIDNPHDNLNDPTAVPISSLIM